MKLDLSLYYFDPGGGTYARCNECGTGMWLSKWEWFQDYNFWNNWTCEDCKKVSLQYYRKKKLRVIVAGSRDFQDYDLLESRLNRILERQLNVEIVSGMCRGADMLGLRYANERTMDFTTFPANWNKFGKSAGPRRNEEMAQYAEALVAFGDGRGTRSMIEKAKQHKLNIRWIK